MARRLALASLMLVVGWFAAPVSGAHELIVSARLESAVPADMAAPADIAALADSAAAADRAAPADSAVVGTPGDSLVAKLVPGITPSRRGNPLTWFLADAWLVASSPARINREGALWTAGVLGTTALFYAYDQEVYDAFQRAQGNAVYDFVVNVGEGIEPLGHMGKTNRFYVVGLAVGTGFKIRPLELVCAEILESHLISGGIRNLAEIFVGRYRPFENRGPRRFVREGGTSFPSGHASVIFELATIASHHAHSRPISILSYGLASAVAIQRVDDSTHWPSDVFIAAVTGHIIARTIVKRHDQRRGVARSSLQLESGPSDVRLVYRF